MLNPNLSLADWHKVGNVDGGMYGYFLDDMKNPENPLLTTVCPRVVTLPPGQVLFRWIDSRKPGLPAERAAGAWWSTKRGAQAILRAAAGGDTSAHARAFSNVARSWGSDLGDVVCATVTGSIRCFLGVGRAIYDAANHEVMDSREHQLFLPHLSVKGHGGRWTLSPDALLHLRIDWIKPSASVDTSTWEQAIAAAKTP